MNRKALRQQMLLRALWRDGSATALQGWARAPPERGSRPTAQMPAPWRIARWARPIPRWRRSSAKKLCCDGARLLASAPARARRSRASGATRCRPSSRAARSSPSEPYLADSARLDWLVHRAARAADAPARRRRVRAARRAWTRRACAASHAGCGAAGKRLAGGRDLACASAAARRSDRFDPVREAFASSDARHAFVRREGLLVRVERSTTPTPRFTRALLARPRARRCARCCRSGLLVRHMAGAALRRRGWIAASTLSLEHHP